MKRGKLALLAIAIAWMPGARGEPLSFTPLNVPGSPYGLNNSGEIVGIFVGGESTASYLYSEGVLTTINLGSGTGPSATLAHGINNVGQIVGAFGSSPAGTQAFVYANGSADMFKVPGSSATVAEGINDLGQIVGYYTDAAVHSTGFVETDGRFTTIAVPGSSGTFPFRITDSGEIVGYSVDDSGRESGFAYRNGSFVPVNVPGADATLVYSINDVGQMVGTFVDATGTHGFLFSDDSFTTFDAPGTPPTRGTFARDINDSGEILVFGSTAFLASESAAVPEPSPFLLTLLGLTVGSGILVFVNRS